MSPYISSGAVQSWGTSVGRFPVHACANSLNISFLQSREGVLVSVFPCMAITISKLSSQLIQFVEKLGAFPGCLLSGLVIPLSKGLLNRYPVGNVSKDVMRANIARDMWSRW